MKDQIMLKMIQKIFTIWRLVSFSKIRKKAYYLSKKKIFKSKEYINEPLIKQLGKDSRLENIYTFICAPDGKHI